MKISVLILLAVSLATVMSASTIMDCEPGTLAYYLTQTQPCMVGSLEFYMFTYSSTATGTSAVPASAITVTPLNNNGNPTLAFASTSWYASGGADMDSAIGYTASTISGQATIDGANIDFNASTTAKGARTVLGEQVCAGGNTAFCNANPQDLYGLRISMGTNPGPQQPSVVFSGPVSTITVLDDLSLVTSTGKASVISTDSDFPTSSSFATPEPITMLLSLSGLLLVLGTAKARRRSQ